MAAKKTKKKNGEPIKAVTYTENELKYARAAGLKEERPESKKAVSEMTVKELEDLTKKRNKFAEKVKTMAAKGKPIYQKRERLKKTVSIAGTRKKKAD